MVLPIAELMDQATFAEAFADLLGLADAEDLETTAWQEGSPSRGVLGVDAQEWIITHGILLEAVKGGLLDYAEGSWLTLLAAQVYTVDRGPAAPASGNLTLTNASGNTYTLNTGDVVAENSVTQKTYRSAIPVGAPIVLGPGATVLVPIVAEESGSASTSGAGSITTLISTFAGVTCTNAAALVGTDEQSDEALKASCRLACALAAIEPGGTGTHLGPESAYRYVATHTPRPTGVLCDVTRVGFVVSGSAITVYLAGASGAPIGGDVTLVEDALIGTVHPLGLGTFTVSACGTVAVPVSCEVFVPDDWAQTDDEIKAAILAACIAVFRDYPIGGLNTAGGGGWLYADFLRSVIERASVGAFSVTLTTPAADVALTASQVATLTMTVGDITITRVAS